MWSSAGDDDSRGGIMRAFILLGCGALLSMAWFAQAEVWSCKKADGTEVFSDRSLGGQCRRLQKLPELIPAPPIRSTTPDAGQSGAADPEQTPMPGGGRRIDPPSDSAIAIR